MELLPPSLLKTQKLLVGNLLKNCCISVSLFIAVVCVFSGGLTGGFILDDYAVLPILFQDIDYAGFWGAIFEGKSGPLGRSVSLFTFALQRSDWPVPYNFKLVNVAIHALNAILIYILTLNILRHSKLIRVNNDAIYFSVVISLLWACTPIQVSSVLYIVQRMTTLSSTFVLLALNIYVFFRGSIESNADNFRLKMGQMSILFSFFALLAVFSKESGFLLTFYILCLELLLPSVESRTIKRWVNCWRVIFILTPILLFISYIVFKMHTSYLHGYAISRNFDLAERIMTESRIILSYLKQIIAPQSSKLGVFHDDILVSKGLFAPFSTFFSIIVILVSALVAIVFRKRKVVISFAILWFLSGHIMESTVIPLELYFEHRNYIALYGVFFGTLFMVFFITEKYRKLKFAIYAFIVLFVFSHVFLTFTQAKIWGSELDFAFQQAEYHPNSIRARSLMVEIMAKYAEIDPDLQERAYEEAKKIQNDFPERISTSLFDIEFACSYGKKYPLLGVDVIIKRINGGLYEPAVIKMMHDLSVDISHGGCKSEEVTKEYLIQILKALIASPNFVPKKSSLQRYLALIYTYQLEYKLAINTMLGIVNKSFEDYMQLSRLLATDQRYEEALSQLGMLKKLFSFDLRIKIKRDEYERLLAVINQDLEQELKGDKN